MRQRAKRKSGNYKTTIVVFPFYRIFHDKIQYCVAYILFKIHLAEKLTTRAPVAKREL
jgi:hypothetical protein